MSDPNGWVQNPPSCFVKVQGTSRETMNNKLGLVVQYDTARARYTILLCESQDTVSLKSDNLVPCGMLDKMNAYIQMLRNNPDVLRQFQQVSQQVHATTGLKPQILLAAIGIALVVGWYLIGFSKVLMLLTIIVMLLTVVGPDIAAGKDMKTVLRAAPDRWKEVVRQQVPVIGQRIAGNKIMLTGFTALLTAFCVYSLVASSSASASPAARQNMSGSAGAATNANTMSRTLTELVAADLQQKYYKLGFDDATNAEIFGASLATAVAEDSAANAAAAAAATEEDDYAWRNNDSSDSSFYPTMPPGKKSPFNMATAFAAFTVYRTLNPLARNAEGQLDLPLLKANLANLEVWKLGILGFSVYRLVSAFM